jgi:hypothetical protein
MTGNKIVPFGKYKGQPLEVMVADRDYVQWLMAQDWFRDKPLYQVIINSGAEPQETPEHNALQVLFLDPGFSLRFARHVEPGCEVEARRSMLAELSKARSDRWVAKEDLATLDLINGAYEMAIKFEPKFEVGDFGRAPVDVLLKGYSSDKRLPNLGSCFFRRTIEIKPSVSDDYPAVLRQMKNSHSEVLLTREYTGQGATREQFVALFETAGIAVVFVDEID